MPLRTNCASEIRRVAVEDVHSESRSRAVSLDCLCAGIIVADSVCQPIARIPPPGTLGRTDRVEFTIGGCSANVAVDMARLDLRVGVSGRVGDDMFGREVRNRLIAERVDCSNLVLSPTAATSTTFVLNVVGEDRRFIHCVGANAEYDGLQLTDADIAGCRILYVGGFGLLEALTPDRVERLFRVARHAGVTTILDVVLPDGGTALQDWVLPVLPWTDYFFPNDDESALLLGETDPRLQAQRFREAGAGSVVITCGSDGALLDAGGTRLQSGVFPVEAIDATGTGDAFVAGFIRALLDGHDPGTCLKYGTAMGASCVRSMGATTGVFSRRELEDFVARHPLPIRNW